MTRAEACQILDVSPQSSDEDIKRAYRRKALLTHPDRGGSPTEFLKVHAAYQVLASSKRDGNTPSAEFDGLLSERLNDVSHAFALLFQQADAYCVKVFDEFHEALITRIRSYSSARILSENAQKDITALWTHTVGLITTYMEKEVNTIADRHDDWLQAYLRPLVEAAKYAHPRRWFESWATLVVAIILGVSAISGGSYIRSLWVAAIGSALLIGMLPPILYTRRYQWKRVIKGVRLTAVHKGSRLQGVAAQSDWISEESAAAGFGMVAANLGAIFLGPVGAIAGGALGALFGWLIGESLDSRKDKLYQSVVEGLDKVIPSMMGQFEEKLRETEAQMLQSIKDNFRSNVQSVVALLRG